MNIKNNKAILLLIIFFIYLNSCVEKFSTQDELSNNAPNTTLANVPVDNDTLNALVKLAWDGEDNDGYVVAYEYKYTTYPLGNSIGDSIVHEWTRIEKNSLTISFTSPDKLNRQRFKVRAVDNSGNIDPTPAEKIFYTKQTFPPTTTILAPRNGEEFFVVEKTSVWFPGIFLKFTGEDKDGHVIGYAWAVDEGNWHWVSANDTIIYIKPEEFGEKLDGEHIIKVISKDDTYLVDPNGDKVSIELVVPSFEKDILILDDTREDISVRNVDDSVIDSFYFDIFTYNNNYIVDQRNLVTRGFPSRKILGKYKLVVWHSDDSKIPFYITNKKALSRITDFLKVGGDLIISGTKILDPFLPEPDPILGWPHPIPVNKNSFAYTYLHIKSCDFSSFKGSFTGANGIGEFSDVEVDTTKMNPGYPQFGKPHLVAVITEKGSFTREILKFKGNDPYASDLPCAIRYYGDIYNIAFVGFPIWALKKEDARIFVSQLLKNMGY